MPRDEYKKWGVPCSAKCAIFSHWSRPQNLLLYNPTPYTNTHSVTQTHKQIVGTQTHTHTHTPHPHTLQSQKPNTLHTKLKFQSKKIKSYSRKAQCMLYKLSFFLETSLLFGSFLSPGGPKCRDLFHFPHVLECFIAVLDCFRKTF